MFVLGCENVKRALAGSWRSGVQGYQPELWWNILLGWVVLVQAGFDWRVSDSDLLLWKYWKGRQNINMQTVFILGERKRGGQLLATVVQCELPDYYRVWMQLRGSVVGGCGLVSKGWLMGRRIFKLWGGCIGELLRLCYEFGLHIGSEAPERRIISF